jgi:hypothetical protein
MTDPTYHLLSDAAKPALREQIKSAHAYFYHGTTKHCLAGIAQNGLDPACEHHESEYFWERLEPDKALRYCTKATLTAAYETAEERARWRDSSDPTRLDPADVILLRAPAEALLNKSFGLDHAFLDDMTVKLERGADGLLPPEKFLSLFNSSGMISCYEVLPREELQIYSGSFFDDRAAIKEDKFIPLGESLSPCI